MGGTVTLDEAQAHLGDLVARLGPGAELVITEGLRPVLRLVGPPAPARPAPGLGLGLGGILHMDPTIDAPLDAHVARWSRADQLAESPTRAAHAHSLRPPALPGHHRDPLDRIMVAQALVEGMTLVTADGKLAADPASRLW